MNKKKTEINIISRIILFQHFNFNAYLYNMETIKSNKTTVHTCISSIKTHGNSYMPAIDYIQ